MNLQEAAGDTLAWIGRERLLLRAGAVSVALHAGLLWPTSMPAVPTSPAQPLVARLTHAIASTGSNVVAEPPAAFARPVSVAAPSAVPRPHTGVVKPSPASAAAQFLRKPGDDAWQLDPGAGAPPLSAATIPASTGGAQSRSDGDSRELASPGAAGAAAAFDLPAEGVDPQALVAYRFALRHVVAKRYPEYARERGWSGTAEVRVTVARSGVPRAVRLTRSTGYRSLDEEARSMIALAAQRAAVPEPLRGLEFSLDIPVIFDIDDEERR